MLEKLLANLEIGQQGVLYGIVLYFILVQKIQKRI
jgi:hypothetical protein